MSFLRLFFVAASLHAAIAFPVVGPNYGSPACAPPQPCVQIIEKPVPYPVIEEVPVAVPTPVPVPVIAPVITETHTRLTSTTSGNGAEQRVTTTSFPPIPVALPLPAPFAPPCGSPQAGAELILNPNAAAAALGAPALALGPPALPLGAPALPLGVPALGAYSSPGLAALNLALGGSECQSAQELLNLANIYDLNGFDLPGGNLNHL